MPTADDPTPHLDPQQSSVPIVPRTPASSHEPTLAYRDVHEDRKGRTKRFLLQMLGGFGVAVLICGACFALLFAVGARFENESSRNSNTRPAALVGWGSLTAVTIVLVALVWWAIQAHRRRGRTGFLVGMLIGVGLSLLPLGLCYTIIGGEAMK